MSNTSDCSSIYEILAGSACSAEVCQISADHKVADFLFYIKVKIA